MPFQISYTPKSVFHLDIPTVGLPGRCAVLPVGGKNAPVFPAIVIMPELAVIAKLPAVTVFARVMFPPRVKLPPTVSLPDTVKSPITLFTLTAV